MKKSFNCQLRGTGPNKAFPYIELPFDSAAFFGTKARVPVKITIRGIEMRMSVAPMGGRHVLGFSRKAAEDAGIAVGDRVRVTIEKDDAERTVKAPAELARALRGNAAANAAWERLSYSHKREHAEAIREAKRPETRARRIEKTLEMLVTTGRPARPTPSTKPLAARLHIKPGMKVVLHAPPRGLVLGVPTASPRTKNPDLVLAFAKNRAALDLQLPKLKSVPRDAALWIAYPKTTSGAVTDLTRDVGWEALERLGLSAVMQVSIDGTWSALRFKRSR